MKTIIILAFLSGCVQTSWIDQSKIGDAPPNADQAINIIAADYGLRAQPNVFWYGKGFDCTKYKYSWLNREGQCVQGVFFDWTQEIAVSNMGMTMPISRTGLAHELCHQLEWEQTGDSDINHSGECFKSGGTVEQENQKLAEMLL